MTDDLLTQLWYRVGREGFTIPYPTRRVLLETRGPASQGAGAPES
jgi:small-conductance mechanosensitive channel